MEQITIQQEKFGAWKISNDIVACFRVKEGMFSDLKGYEVNDNVEQNSIERLKEVHGSQTVILSTDYLKQLMKIVAKNKINVISFTVANNYPLIATTKDMEFIIAPRVEVE